MCGETVILIIDDEEFEIPEPVGDYILAIGHELDELREFLRDVEDAYYDSKAVPHDIKARARELLARNGE